MDNGGVGGGGSKADAAAAAEAAAEAAAAAAAAEAAAVAACGKPELCFETSAIYCRQLAVGERCRWT